MERFTTNVLAAAAAVVIVVSTWAPVITIPPAEVAAIAVPALA